MNSILKVGLAQINISPQESCVIAGFPLLQLIEDAPEMGGYVGRRGPSVGVADPLYAKILVASWGTTQVAIVALDVLVVTLEFTQQIRQQVAARLGIPPSNVLLAASHTHSGPELFGMWDANDPKYERELILEGIVQGIEKAAGQMVEATIGMGLGDFTQLIINRRDPRLEVDSELSVVRFDSRSGPLAILFNIACHPLILDYRNYFLSADFVGPAAQVIETVFNRETLALFLNGAAGDINPARFPYQPKMNIYDEMFAENYPVFWGTYEEMQRFGQVLGGETLRVAAAIKTEPCQGIAVASVAVHLPLKHRDDVERHCRFMNYAPQFSEKLLETNVLSTEVQALRLGGVVLIAIPGELFSEIGRRIKQNVKGLMPIIVGYANDDVRYILTEDCYDVNRYETWGTPLAKGSAALIEEAALHAVAAVQINQQIPNQGLL